MIWYIAGTAYLAVGPGLALLVGGGIKLRDRMETPR
jgi:hypothetical protein